MSFVLGITGGIATGKSTAVEVFQKYDFPIVDGDQVARQVVEPGTPGGAAVVSEFGDDILQKNGSLDRKKLGRIVFSDKQKLDRLNQILNPYIRSEILRQIEKGKSEAPLVIADIPLMYEGHYDHYMDQVAVVYLPEEIQLERLMKRDNLSLEEASKRIKSQLSMEEKRRRADIFFDNQGTIQQLQEQITSWLRQKKFI